jgi:hypothetical protein
MRFLPLPPLELVPVQNFDDVLDFSSYFFHGRNVSLFAKMIKAVLGIRDILVRIRIGIHGSIPLTTGSGSGSNSGSNSFLQ